MRNFKMIKVIISTYIFIILAVSFLSIFHNDNKNTSNDYAKITDVDYTALVVDEPYSNGKIVVTEKLTYDIHAASKNNLFWELWRDLPETYVDGVKVSYKVNSVKQILNNGQEIVYTESPKLYWNDSDYTDTYRYGPGKWYHSPGPYNESARQYECLMFYIPGTYRDKLQFEIEYEITNVSLRYNDCSEFYLSFYSEDTINDLQSFKGQVLFPNNIMPSKGNYEAYAFGTNSNTLPFTESDTKNPGYHTFSIELNEEQLSFKPYNEYIEFTLLSYGNDKHIFTQYASKNDYYYDNVLDECKNELKNFIELPEKSKNLKVLFFMILVILTCLAVTSATRTFNKIKKKNTFYEPENKIQYFRDIPSDLDPHFAAALVFCKQSSSKYKKDEYSAIMLSLVRKKYIELVRISPEKDWIDSNIKIIIKYTGTKEDPLSIADNSSIRENAINAHDLEPLSRSETLYFNLIVKYAKSVDNNLEITLKNFQDNISRDYQNTNSFVQHMDESIITNGTLEGYFQKANFDEPKKSMRSKSIRHFIYGILFILVNMLTYQTRLDFAFGGFFLLAFGYFISSIRHKLIANKGILLTQFGEDEYEKWRGLYNFLNSETLMNERTVVELPIWEKYLVYATAFGISEKVIKALKIRCPEIENSAILSTPYYHSAHFYHYNKSFRTATHTASYTYRSGGHGGYGGGGRGGGGGGGGH